MRSAFTINLITIEEKRYMRHITRPRGLRVQIVPILTIGLAGSITFAALI